MRSVKMVVGCELGLNIERVMRVGRRMRRTKRVVGECVGGWGWHRPRGGALLLEILQEHLQAVHPRRGQHFVQAGSGPLPPSHWGGGG